MTIILIIKLIQLAAIIAAILILAPIVNGTVFFPSRIKNVDIMVKLAEIQPGGKTVDLGSGDGRIVMVFAKAGAEAHGYEINPFLVFRSRRAVKKAGLGNKAFIHWGSFWHKDLSEYPIVTVYGIPYIMKRLGKKLERELKPGARIISNIYEFPSWKPMRKEESVFLYINGTRLQNRI